MKHKVRTGETLTAIARKYRITLGDLIALNPRYRGQENLVRVGAQLTVPDKNGSPEERAAASSNKFTPQTMPTDRENPPLTSPAPHRRLGTLSMRYETGGRGSSTVSTGKGDYGGVSYGCYQMTSRPKGGTVTRFVQSECFPWRGAFDGLVAGTPAFTGKWRALVTENPALFEQAEHAFIERTHYQGLCANILRVSGINVSERSNALQNVIWSVAVQHGANSKLVDRAIAAMFEKEGKSPKLDEHVIDAIYAERSRLGLNGTLAYFSKNSAAVQKGVRSRFEKEREDALAWLRKDPIFGSDA